MGTDPGPLPTGKSAIVDPDRTPWSNLREAIEEHEAELRDLDAGDPAIALYAEAEARAAHLLRENVINKLAAAILADLKADGPAPLPTNQQQARELLGVLGKQLTEAAQSLAWAAERLKQKGDPHGASQVHVASLRVQAAAQGVR